LELIGDVGGGQVDAFGADATAFQFVRGKVSGRLRQPAFDLFGVLGPQSHGGRQSQDDQAGEPRTHDGRVSNKLNRILWRVPRAPPENPNDSALAEPVARGLKA
jgi:hypothetical protein